MNIKQSATKTWGFLDDPNMESTKFEKLKALWVSEEKYWEGAGLRNYRLKLREKLRENLENVKNSKKEEGFPMETGDPDFPMPHREKEKILP